MLPTLLDPPSPKTLPLNHAQSGAYFLLLKLLLWLFVRDEGEIFGKAERFEAPDDLQKIKNIISYKKWKQSLKLKQMFVFKYEMQYRCNSSKV